jgi:molecular chaperone GrpE
MNDDKNSNPDEQSPEAPPATDACADAFADPLTPEALDELRKRAAESDELRNSLLRTQADYENSLKRLERTMSDRTEHAIEEFAAELLPVIDNLSLALQAAEQHDTVDQILEGVRIVEKQLFDALDRHGVTPIATEQGQEFDPNVHEAMTLIPTAEQAPNTIVQEVQRGFYIKKRLLRPARVLVSAPPADNGDKE